MCVCVCVCNTHTHTTMCPQALHTMHAHMLKHNQKCEHADLKLIQLVPKRIARILSDFRLAPMAPKEQLCRGRLADQVRKATLHFPHLTYRHLIDSITGVGRGGGARSEMQLTLGGGGGKTAE